MLRIYQTTNNCKKRPFGDELMKLNFKVSFGAMDNKKKIC